MDKLVIKSVLVLGLLIFIGLYVAADISSVKILFAPSAAFVAASSSLSTSSSTSAMVSTSAAMSTSTLISAATTTAIVTPTLFVQPENILQGDPVMVTVGGTRSPRAVTFNGVLLTVVDYQSLPTAFIGIALDQKPGTYPLVATLANGTVLRKNITVLERPKVQAALGIPAQLGGNTPAAATNLVDSLTADNQVLASLVSAKQSYWTKPFQFPVANPIVTDIYGYTRQTGQYEIAHKGTDFKAPPGTPVMAINDGIIIYAKDLGIYGNTIIVDHGGGIMSFYMHLSKIGVTLGERVTRGEVIGASGETGYAEGPHLHLTVRIGGVSIDPMIFLGFFQ